MKSLVTLLVLAVAAPAAAEDPAARPIEVTAAPSFGFFVDRDENEDIGSFGGGVDVSLRYFNPRGHGLFTAGRFESRTQLCIFDCGSSRNGALGTVSVGWAYRADFAARPHRAVWFDVTPHVALQAGYLGGDFEVGLVGMEVGFDVNLHVRGFVVGLGGSYAALGATRGGPIDSGTFGVRFGWAGGPARGPSAPRISPDPT
ncbi:MAG: hypothetical protein H6720_11245 [Sandaracinus sp.]|nr:hypothetical protein [Sandaracinus sp.]